MYQFPKDLYTDVRIEETDSTNFFVKNGDVEADSATSVTGAIIRIYDGTMWYTGTTNDIAGIQAEIDNLATLATPNPDILNDPEVAAFETNKDTVLLYEGENDLRKVPREKAKELILTYLDECVDQSIPELKLYTGSYNSTHIKKQFYSSKGAAIVQDMQYCTMSIFYCFTVNDITTEGGKYYTELSFDRLLGRTDEIIAERDRYLDYARNAVDVVPGDYTCILSPIVTAMFTHESFGHKSESDFMLNDKTLQDEWEIGKKVGNERITIRDIGNLPNHGYVPYDDEGTKAKGVCLIEKGVLTGRLHDAKSATTLGEALTGNARAESYLYTPMVRMTNTYIEGGTDDPEDMIKEVTDGIYVYQVNYGTGMSTFTMQPSLCYRIRDGKLCEPVRANVVTGNVFKTLFDIDAVGTDFELFDTYVCGKNGQSAPVSAGGPTIRVKTLTVN